MTMKTAVIVENNEQINQLQRTMAHVRAVSHLAKKAIETDVAEHDEANAQLIFDALDLIETLAAETFAQV